MVYIILQQEIKIMEQNESFFNKNKKEIIIILISLLIFSFLFYFLFYKKNSNSQSTNSISLLSKSSDFIKNIFTNNNNNNNNSTTTNTTVSDNYYFEKLTQVWDKPVAGYSFYYKPYNYTYTDESGNTQTGTDISTVLIFMDSITGNIYEKNLLEPTSTPIQLTNSNYTNIVKAYFLNDKNNLKNKVVFQYLKNNTIKTVSASIPNYFGSPTDLLNITNLPDNIKNINTSSNNQFLSFLVEKKSFNNDVSSDWYLITKDGDNYGKKVFSSELSAWKLNVTNSGNIFAYNTDSSYEPSSLYKLSSGSLSSIYSEHTGMSFSINKNILLSSIFTDDGLKTYLNKNFTEEAFNDSSLFQLNFNTLSNKCDSNVNVDSTLIICSVPKEIQNYDSGLPDAWYQGMTSWDDNLYIVNKDYPNGNLFFDFNKDGKILQQMDLKNLKINNFNSYLGFINKNDSSLWTLNIGNILNQNGD